MKVIADICIVPVGVGVSVSKYIAVCEKILNEAGLNPRLHAYGTNIEGEWDAVFAAAKRCHEIVHKMGSPEFPLQCVLEPGQIKIRRCRTNWIALPKK